MEFIFIYDLLSGVGFFNIYNEVTLYGAESATSSLIIANRK